MYYIIYYIHALLVNTLWNIKRGYDLISSGENRVNESGRKINI